MSVVYILGEFPSYSEHFILNEIIELKKREMEIKIFAVRQVPSPEGKAEELVKHKVIYSNYFISGGSLKAHFYLINTFWRNYFKTLKDLLLTSKGSFFAFLKEVRNFTIAAQFLFNLKNDTVHHIHAHFVSLPAIIALRMSQLSGISFSCSAHAHDIYTSDITELSRRLSAAKFFVTCTSFNKKYLDSCISNDLKEKIIHIYHGIDLTQWPKRNKSYLREEEIHILTIGRLVEKKGIIFLLEAVKLLKEAGFKIKVSVIGDGPLMEDFKNYTKINHLNKIICFYGFLEQDAVKIFYQKADVFILPCIVTANGDRDGLPNVLLEALTVGIPVITTPVSAIPELIVDGETGVIIPERNAVSISSAIVKLLNAPDLCRLLTENGRRKVEQKFNIIASTDRLAQLLYNYKEDEEDQRQTA